MYKNQLQELAQRSCFNLPSYACIREGPDHAPRFKATVNFNGEVFESPGYCSTLRQAEHAAAEVALNNLSRRGPAQSLAARILDETGVCKNLLQETAQRAGVDLPVYTTGRSGPGHLPVFTCSVEVAGLQFVGETAKTKKQAEKNAAMAAWSALKLYASKGKDRAAFDFETMDEQEQNNIIRALATASGQDERGHSAPLPNLGPMSGTLRSPRTLDLAPPRSTPPVYQPHHGNHSAPTRLFNNGRLSAEQMQAAYYLSTGQMPSHGPLQGGGSGGDMMGRMQLQGGGIPLKPAMAYQPRALRQQQAGSSSHHMPPVTEEIEVHRSTPPPRAYQPRFLRQPGPSSITSMGAVGPSQGMRREVGPPAYREQQLQHLHPHDLEEEWLRGNGRSRGEGPPPPGSGSADTGSQSLWSQQFWSSSREAGVEQQIILSMQQRVVGSNSAPSVAGGGGGGGVGAGPQFSAGPAGVHLRGSVLNRSAPPPRHHHHSNDDDDGYDDDDAAQSATIQVLSQLSL